MMQAAWPPAVGLAAMPQLVIPRSLPQPAVLPPTAPPVLPATMPQPPAWQTSQPDPMADSWAAAAEALRATVSTAAANSSTTTPAAATLKAVPTSRFERAADESVSGGLAQRVINAAMLSSARVDRERRDTADEILRRALTERGESQACPGWDGLDPARTLRPWLRSQLFWQSSTTAPPAKWGMKLYHALPEHSLPRLLADSLGEDVIMSVDGYVSI